MQSTLSRYQVSRQFQVTVDAAIEAVHIIRQHPVTVATVKGARLTWRAATSQKAREFYRFCGDVWLAALGCYLTGRSFRRWCDALVEQHLVEPVAIEDSELDALVIEVFAPLPVFQTAPRQPRPGIQWLADRESAIAEQTTIEPDPWETVEVEPVQSAAIAPLYPVVPYLLALPPAREQQSDWATMTPEQLRRECQRRSIRWRNAHGKGKHLRKGEMVAALSA